MKKILIVDDETQIIKSLQRMFMDTDYEIFTADNSMDATKLLETTPVDMVISDMRMPLYDGYKLLSNIKEKYPKTIRIILSGYADEKPLFRAILHNIAKFYVFKPWNNNTFLQNIDKIFTVEDQLNEEAFSEKIAKYCPSISISEKCEAMLSLIEDENMDGLIDAIEKDLETSNLLLQVANDAVYGAMPTKVKQTAIYLGLLNMKSFLRWAMIVDSIKPEQQSCEVTSLLLQHAYYTNRIFLFLYEVFLHKQPPESAMFAGLMHNVGLLLLANKSDQYDVSTLTVDDLKKLEHETGELHEEIGAHILNHWDLPYTIYEVAYYHHDPMNKNIINKELVSCVHIAQAYACMALGCSDSETVAPEVFESLGISVEDFERRLGRLLKQLISTTK
jgi:Response regulator containing CheY-like receiver, AAA-type ATPase, and DNA-binding domains